MSLVVSGQANGQSPYVNPREVEACRKAGGTGSAFDCRCPDGIQLRNAYAQRCLNRPWTPAEIRQECGRYEDAAQSPILPEEVVLFAKNSKVTSAKELFERMQSDAKWKPFLTDYVYQIHSESKERDAVDPKYPRRIKFHRGLIIASTAHPDFPEINNTVPMFVAEKDGWQTAELTFPNGVPTLKRNPGSCLRCHGDQPRPNWPSYRVWPGSLNNRFDYTIETRVHERDAKELKVAEDTLRQLQQRGYRIRPEDIQRVLNRRTVTRVEKPLTDEYRILSKETRFGEDTAGFNSFLNRWNFKIIANQLHKNPDFEKLQYALVGALMKCDDIPGFLGAPGTAFRSQHEQKLKSTYGQILGEVQSKTQERLNYKVKRAVSLGDQDASDRSNHNHDIDNSRAAALRYLFEGSGTNVKNFSLDYTPKRDEYGYEFNQIGGDNGGLHGLLCNFLPEVIESDPSRLASVGAVGVNGYGSEEDAIRGKACEILRQKSLAVVTGKKAPSPSQPAAPKRSFLGRIFGGH